MWNDAIVPVWILHIAKTSEIYIYMALSSACGLRSGYLVDVEDIAKMCRFSMNKTRRTIKSLEEKGLIVTSPSIRQDNIYCTVVYVDPAQI
jgi:DNA-binding MarR family transcriptional regulator